MGSQPAATCGTAGCGRVWLGGVRAFIELGSAGASSKAACAHQQKRLKQVTVNLSVSCEVCLYGFRSSSFHKIPWQGRFLGLSCTPLWSYGGAGGMVIAL